MAPVGRLRAFASRRAGWLFLLLVVVLVVWMQWPVVLGSVYRVGGVEPPDSGIGWWTDAAAAADHAAMTGKPILLDFTADWCPPCRVMDHQVWPNADVVQRLERDYVPVKVDVDLPSNRQLVARYGVYAIPAVFVVDAEGHVLEFANYLSAGDMVAFLDHGSARFAAHAAGADAYSAAEAEAPTDVIPPAAAPPTAIAPTGAE